MYRHTISRTIELDAHQTLRIEAKYMISAFRSKQSNSRQKMADLTNIIFILDAQATPQSAAGKPQAKATSPPGAVGNSESFWLDRTTEAKAWIPSAHRCHPSALQPSSSPPTPQPISAHQPPTLPAAPDLQLFMLAVLQPQTCSPPS